MGKGPLFYCYGEIVVPRGLGKPLTARYLQHPQARSVALSLGPDTMWRAEWRIPWEAPALRSAQHPDLQPQGVWSPRKWEEVGWGAGSAGRKAGGVGPGRPAPALLQSAGSQRNVRS